MDGNNKGDEGDLKTKDVDEKSQVDSGVETSGRQRGRKGELARAIGFDLQMLKVLLSRFTIYMAFNTNRGG
jgi:hypothetical protein